MSIYLKAGKGWRYDFTLNGQRHTQSGFKSKREVQKAEAKRKEELQTPYQSVETQTDIGFLELVNGWLDDLEAYKSHAHYRDNIYRAKRWIKMWGGLLCVDIASDVVQRYLLKRRKETSAITANSELKNLRALFNFGIRKKLFVNNPTAGIPFFPIDRNEKYVPLQHDISSILLAASPVDQDYLLTIRETLARVNEINQLLWQDVDLHDRSVILYTRKKRGGHKTPRRVPMTETLYKILSRRYENNTEQKPWVFWHRYWSRKQGKWIEGPYANRKNLLHVLCKKAGVKYFSYHALRHFGASILDRANVNIGSIQRLLGHEKRTTTEIYLHSIGEAEREAMKVFERITEDSHTDSHTKAQ
jgi:integrase